MAFTHVRPIGDSYELHIDGMTVMDAFGQSRTFSSVSGAEMHGRTLLDQDQGCRLQVVAVSVGALFAKEYLPSEAAAFMRDIRPGMTKVQVTRLALDRGLKPQWSPSGNGFGTVHKLSLRINTLTVSLIIKMAPVHNSPSTSAWMGQR